MRNMLERTGKKLEGRNGYLPSGDLELNIIMCYLPNCLDP